MQKYIENKLKQPDNDREDRKDLLDLKRGRTLAILHTDKTGKIAILDREDYNNKMNVTIAGLQSQEVSKDPNPKLFEK